MTKEKAVEISKVLDALESFEMFEDNLESFLREYEEIVPDFHLFRYELMLVVENEKVKRMAKLEEM